MCEQFNRMFDEEGTPANFSESLDIGPTMVDGAGKRRAKEHLRSPRINHREPNLRVDTKNTSGSMESLESETYTLQTSFLHFCVY